MLEEMKRLEQEALAKLEDISEAEALESWRLAFLGRRGQLTMALRSIGKLPREERPAAGQLANQIRLAIEAAFEERRQVLRQEALAASLAEGETPSTLYASSICCVFERWPAPAPVCPVWAPRSMASS